MHKAFIFAVIGHMLSGVSATCVLPKGAAFTTDPNFPNALRLTSQYPPSSEGDWNDHYCARVPEPRGQSSPYHWRCAYPKEKAQHCHNDYWIYVDAPLFWTDQRCHIDTTNGADNGYWVCCYTGNTHE